MKKHLLFVGAILSLSSSPVLAQNETLALDSIHGSEYFNSVTIGVRWAPDGSHFTHTVPNPDGGHDLVRVEAESGDSEVLVAGPSLTPEGQNFPLNIESYQISEDGKKILIFTNSVRVWRQNTLGEYFVWDFDDETLTKVSQEPDLQQFAKFSPDGNLVGFVRANNIFVVDLRSGIEHQITSDGSEEIINGTADWVYEEELGLRDGFRISPDGTKIAFWRFDQSIIPPFYLIDETTLYPELTPVRYPKAGTANSTVTVGVADIETAETAWVDYQTGSETYVAQMGFHSANEIWLTRLTRHQNRLDVMLADVGTGAARVIMTDSSDTWVQNESPTWIDGGERFLFRSERDGFNHLYVFRADGTLERQLTSGEWEVSGVAGVDDDRNRVYFTGTEQGPLGRQLYRVDFDGDDFRRVTEGAGTHNINLSPTFRYFVDSYSTINSPPMQVLREEDGDEVRVLAENERLRTRLSVLDIAAPEFVTVPAADGTDLNAWVIKPVNFDPERRYPLLMYVYGGPGSQTVRDSWGGSRYLWHQMLANEGYIIASVDNRGTGARGRDFKTMTYLNLGINESDDQISAARFLGDLPYVDETRMGIWGWSYGGYMSSLSLMRGPDVFKAAVAVAPVTDWRLYDTIYTERFMRTPQENASGYTRGAPQTYADSLRGNLLLVHGSGDDNVHYQNTLQLAQKLEEAGKEFDMRVYPNKTHSIAGGNTRTDLFTYMTGWLRDNLYRTEVPSNLTP